jgi:hypothetical protein
MASGPRRLRAWKPSGFYRRAPTPRQVERASSLREQLVADRGGREMLTTAESLLIDLIVGAAVKHNDAISYLRGLPRPWANRKTHASWPIVLNTTALANHLAGLLDRLGYDRRAQEVTDIAALCATAVATRPPPTAPAPEEAIEIAGGPTAEK